MRDGSSIAAMAAGAAGSETTDVLSAEPPRFSAGQAAEIAAACFGLRGTASGLDSERDQNFLITDDGGERAVLKISNASEPVGVVEMEIAAALHAKRTDPELPIALPRRLPGASGSEPAAHRATTEGAGGASHHVRVYDFMPGDADVDPLSLGGDELWDFGRVLARLGRALRGFFHPAAGRPLLWDIQHVAALRPLAAQVADRNRRELLERTIDRFEQRVLPRWPLLRAQVIHGDLSINNVTVDDDREITGIIDFGDMSHTALVADITAAWASIAWRHRGEELYRAAGALLDGYRSIIPLEQLELELLRGAVRGPGRRLRVDLRRAGRRATPTTNYIAELRHPRLAAARALRRARAGRNGTTLRLPLVHAGEADRGAAQPPPRGARPGADAAHLPAARCTGRGRGRLDASTPTGNRYLDAYNNVPVVGHCHPRVVEALARQARTLNTNLRYLHEAVIELAERLLASMPADAGLDTVMFVNSGSEANDLAWRVATAYTGAGGGLSSEYSYHGISNVIADLSPEGSGAPMAADVSVSRRRRARTAAAPPRRRTPRRSRGSPSAVSSPPPSIIDGAFTSDGIFPPPPAYLEEIVAPTHAAGGALRRRRGPGRARPQRRRAVVVRRLAIKPGHRHDRQADGQRLSDRGGRHPPRDRRAASRDATRVLQHLRRQPVPARSRR